MFAKSSIESKILKALLFNKICHEDFETTHELNHETKIKY